MAIMRFGGRCVFVPAAHRSPSFFEQVIADPYYYQEQARKINEILKAEFLDKGKPIEPRPKPDPVVERTLCAAMVLWVVLFFVLGGQCKPNPPFWQIAALFGGSIAGAVLPMFGFLMWWFRMGPGRDPPTTASEAKKDQ